MIKIILSTLSAAITIYTLLCFLDIILSWFPGAKFTSFGRFITSLCDPYLRMFSKFQWLHIGNIDFSPIVSLGILSLISTILSRIINTGVLHIGGILGTIIYSFWNIASSLLSVFFLLILVRWIVLLANRGATSYNSIWNQIDNMLQNISYKIAGTFVKNNLDYKKALLVSWISLLVVLLAGHVLIRILVVLCNSLPI